MWYLIVLALSACGNCWAMDGATSSTPAPKDSVVTASMVVEAFQEGKACVIPDELSEKTLIKELEGDALYKYEKIPGLLEFINARKMSTFMDNRYMTDCSIIKPVLKKDSLRCLWELRGYGNDRPYKQIVKCLIVSSRLHSESFTLPVAQVPQEVVAIEHISQELVGCYKNAEKTDLVGIARSSEKKSGFKKVSLQHVSEILLGEKCLIIQADGKEHRIS